MTSVEFHTGVVDPIDYGCRLLRKAARRGVAVRVTAPPEMLDELDRLLWTIDEADFVPHVRIPGASEAVARRTPLWLLDAAAAEPSVPEPPPVRVNIGAAAPAASLGWSRLIEVVSNQPEAAAAGRARWRDYKARGFAIVHHVVTPGDE